jgi:hypothetical protein
MWFNFYSFDVMGDLAFGKSFDMLSNGTKHPFMELTHSHMLVAGSLSRLAWIFPLLKRISIFNQKTCELEERIKQLVDWRIKVCLKNSLATSRNALITGLERTGCSRYLFLDPP